MEGLAEAADQRDWRALPTGVLQHVCCLASTWQTPGPCLAAPVCRMWRSAAAACSSIRLLYHTGRAADQSFRAWVERNARQLEALVLMGLYSEQFLQALAEAAAAAQAAGVPLMLHTLRVLQDCVDARTTGQLLACLPYLRCLQLGIRWPDGYGDHSLDTGRAAVLEHLAPLQRATQLEELYLRGLFPQHQSMADLLPPSLKRLSWDPAGYILAALQYDLSHLKQLTFLRLRHWPVENLTGSQLPPILKQLEVAGFSRYLFEVLEEQRQVLTAWDINYLEEEEVQQQLRHLPNLRAVGVHAAELRNPAARAALQELSQVSALTAKLGYWPMGADPHPPAVVTMAASMHSLRRLHLRCHDLSAPPALDALTQLTQLRVSIWSGASGGILQQQQQQHRAWSEVVGRMAGLRWLSVPDVLLTPGKDWLGGLQQLRVLVVRWIGPLNMVWLYGCSREVLPPQLQVLGVSGMTAHQAASWQVRRRLRQALGSSGCEVVVGADLDEVAGPTQQLAGLPAALQRALA